MKRQSTCSVNKLTLLVMVKVANQLLGIKFSVRCSYRAEEDDLAFSFTFHVISVNGNGVESEH
ncbi:hypothetical protein SADUNF_Sadunf02G0063800 [Salix dunnii]|uniref:Uncharacterized protein n=1 Tax=Salix dunnii TaxID=1413687 RepID=A0A835TGM1_9ROSI|nr:hypothetical protein SADUNF_Sadunf02G0063800 [Salix dunnii]